MNRLLAMLVTVALAFTMVVAGPAPDADAAEPCVNVLALWARGSGISQNLQYDTEGRLMRDELRARLPGASIRYLSVDYPADGSLYALATATNPWGPYRDSMRQGRDAVRDFVTAEASRCPSQRIVLMGYSQGAHAVTDALLTNLELYSEVTAVALFGSPIHNPDAPYGIHRGTSKSYRIGTWITGRGMLGLVNWSSHANGKVADWCIKDDPVCNYYGASHAATHWTTHLTYDDAYVAEAAQWIANKMPSSWRSSTSTHSANMAWARSLGINLSCSVYDTDVSCSHLKVNRAELAIALQDALGLPNRSSSQFTDLSGYTAVARNAIGAIAYEGITRGCNPPTNSKFCPGHILTRQQLATFFVRSFSTISPSDIDRFIDVSPSNVHWRNINGLAETSVTKGCNPPTNNRFCPTSQLTKGQLATFLRRALSL